MYKMIIEFKSVKSPHNIVEREFESEDPEAIRNWFNRHIQGVHKRTLNEDFYFKVKSMSHELNDYLRFPKKLAKIVF